MAANLVLVDTNILMELFFQRSKYDLAVRGLTTLPEEDIVCISILSLTTLLYYVEADKFDKEAAHNFLKGFKILDMNDTDYSWAEANDQGDFEDAIQVACARRHDCSNLFTLDKKLRTMYGKYLPIHTLQ